MNDRMIVMKNWLDNIKNVCSKEQMKEICYGILMYGLYDEKTESSDPMVQMGLNFVLPQISNMLNAYESSKEYGKTHGKKKIVDDDKVYELACQGLSGLKIAEELGVGKTTIYDSDGWKRFKGNKISGKTSEIPFNF